METIDSAISRQLPAVFPHVGLGIESSPSTSLIYNVSAKQKGVALPTQCNPLHAHKSLFALASGNEVGKRFDADSKLLDFLADDVRRMRARLDRFEKAKLDRYVVALESINDRRRALIGLTERIKQSAPQADERFGAKSYAFERMEAQLENAAGALIAGLTNVVTISSGAGREQTGVNFDGAELGSSPGPVSAHEVGHEQVVKGFVASEWHVRTRRRHCEILAKLISKLDSIPEYDGTMMDNTVIVYLSDAAEAHHPAAHEWPVVVIGDLGGRLRTRGRYLRFPWYGKSGHRTMASFYLALLHALGDRRQSFGIEDPMIADLDQRGPLTEILA